jgi:hypothetical protein
MVSDEVKLPFQHFRTISHMVSEPSRFTTNFDLMAPSTSSSVVFNAPNISHLSNRMLDNSTSYLTWTSQFLPTLRSNDLLGIVDGTEPCPPKSLVDPASKEDPQVNPDFVLWVKKDQWCLSWFNTCLSESILSSVYGLETSRQVWSYLASRFAYQSRSRIAHLKRQLQSLQQGTSTCSEFLQLAKSQPINWPPLVNQLMMMT